MSQPRNSYITKHSIAPYKRPSPVAPPSTKPSFFKKIKSFFEQTKGATNDSNKLPKNIKNSGRQKSSIHIPGGFYNEENALQESVLSSSMLDERINSTFMEDGEEDPNVSNAKLASFFKEKGDRPLSEMEMEGVISVMKRCRSVSSTPYASRIISDSGSIRDNKILRSKSEAVGTPLGAAQYNPKFDETSFATSSLRSAKSSVTRRVFDYSKLTSPYRSTVYKYSAAGNKPKNESTVENKNKVSRNRVVPKKLSNTASALISILDGNQENKGNEDTSIVKISKVANPYSSHVTKIRKGKKETQSNAPVTPAKLAAERAILDESLTSNTKNDSKDASNNNVSATRKMESELKSHDGPNKGSLFTESSKPFSDEIQLPALNVDKYKPNKSSSLRQTVTAIKPSPIKVAETETSSLPSVPTSSFNFSFTGKGSLNTKNTLSEGKNPNGEEDNEHGSNSTFHFAFAKNESVNAKKSNEFKSDFDKDQKVSSESIKSSNLDSNMPAKLSPNVDEDKGFIGRDPIFDFGDIPPSSVDKSSIDQTKVEQFRSMFLF